MRLLIDACVARAVVEAVRNQGFDADSVAEWDRDPGDRRILEIANESGRVLITRDRDFGELIFRDGSPHQGVLRLAGQMTYFQQAILVLGVLVHHEADLDAERS